MSLSARNMAPEFQFRLRQIALQQRRVQWIRAWFRFGVATICITAIATAFLYAGQQSSLLKSLIAASYILVEALLLWRLVIRPTRRPPTLRDIAIFLDEHHPELQSRFVSTVEFSTEEYTEASPWMIEQFLKETRSTVKPSVFVDLLDTKQTAKMALSFGLAFLAPAAIVLFFHQVWLPSLHLGVFQESTLRPSFDFEVEPGNVRVRIGENQVVWVKSNKGRKNFSIRWRLGDGAWQASVMEPGSADDVYFKEFLNIQEDIQYEVHTGRLATETYRITAWLPPEVDSIDVTYTYPEYLRKKPREVPNSGNITAIQGTQVGLSVWVNKRLKSAELVLESGQRIPLNEQGESLWTGDITVIESDKYYIELTDFEDAQNEFNAQYHITARIDEPPSIHIRFPRNDVEVSLLDEVPFDFDISDDFGIDEFGIQYQIAGRDVVRVALSAQDSGTLQAKASHRISLEELGLETGDLVTWTVWAKDRKPDRSEYEQYGDPYFLEVRPFKRKYRESITDQSGGGGGGGMDDALNEKDILIATWKLRKDAARIPAEEFEKNRDIIIESQKELLNKFLEASIQSSENSEVITGITFAMAEAVKHLKASEFPYPEPELSEAMVHEQKAYRLIIKLQPLDSQVQRNQGGNGGAGGGQSNRPDINELELDRNRNFFEEESLTQPQEEAIQEALNKIKELAQRQKMINDEIARLVSEKEKAKDKEDRQRLQRELERLQEEERRNLANLDDLERQMADNRMNGQSGQEARQALSDVREQMNRSLENLENNDLQRARASGSRAVAGLNDLEDKLQSLSGAAVAQRMKSLQREMERLLEAEQEILDEAGEMRERHETPGLQNMKEIEERKERLLEKKDKLAEDFTEMMEHASDIAQRAAETQQLTSRKLGDWLRETSREGILEDIEESKPLVKHGFWESAVRQEQRTYDKMDRAAANLQRVAENLVEDDLEGMQKALEELRRLTDDGSSERVQVADAEGIEEGASQERSRQMPGAEMNDQDREGQQDSPQQDGQASSNQGNQSRSSANSASPGARGGSFNGSNQWNGRNWGGPETAQELERFFDVDYQRWLEAFRDAESLLPENSEYRSDVSRIRNNLEELRLRYRRSHLIPRFDLFLEQIAHPYLEATEALDEEIQRRLKNKEFVLSNEGAVPPSYRKRVANYFRTLSEAEVDE